MTSRLCEIYNFGVKQTELFYSNFLSNLTKNNVFIKREDLQDNKSFKIRGAINNILNQIELSKENNDKQEKIFVCASTGNHAQGVAMACYKMKKKGIIFMPKIASQIKINKTKDFGKNFIEIKLIGNNFDECLLEAEKYTKENNACFIHPYDDKFTIEGQSSLMEECIKQLEEQNKKCNLVFCPVGGGGLISGIINVCKKYDKEIKVVGCQTELCHPLTESLKQKQNIESNILQKEIITDGSLVKKLGNLTWNIISNYNNFDLEVLSNDKVLYCMGLSKTEHDINTEGAGGLSFAGFLQYVKKHDIKNQNVILVNSGGNVLQDMQNKSIDFYQTKSFNEVF